MSPRSLVRFEEVRRRGKDVAVQESDAPYAEGRYYDANCQATNVVNDCVHVVGETADTPDVDKSDPTQSVTMPSTGIIVKKYTSTTCIVQHLGVITTISGLVPGAWYFVGSSGQPDILPPASPAIRQIFGFALGASKLLLTPNFMAENSIFSGASVYQQELIGVKDGLNVVFNTPDNFLPDTIRVYRNGNRQMKGSGFDYTISESGGVGTGYDTVTFGPEHPPIAYEILFADYVISV